MRRGEIIAIGSELLLGGRLDTNSLFLTEELAGVGVEVRFKTAVGDEEDEIAAAIKSAVQRADIVILTGGLGPTSDDRTRQAVARATKRPLHRRVEAFEGMRRRMAVWGRTPSAAHRRQALIPSGADVLANPVGSAPGFCLMWRGCLLCALPGVPAEAKGMFVESVLPRLAATPDTHRGAFVERQMLHTFGVPESEVEERIKGLVPSVRGVRLGLLSSPLGVTISLTAFRSKGTAGKKRAASPLDDLVRNMRKRIGTWLYAEGTETMEEVVGRRLSTRGLTIAVAESCTGGLIGHRLTQVAGSSAYLDRVVVSYSNQSKVELLGVPDDLIAQHGAVSPEVAGAMASGIRLRSRVNIGLSITGIAGPEGGTPKKPVGLVYVGLDSAISSQRSQPEAGHPRVEEFRFHGDRHTIKLRASQAALDVLRRWLES
ncbi:MAG: competence/damage-inducible protein A [Nitrospiraceae bacterium]